MAVATVDLNCDLGEGFGVWQPADDAALLEVVTSANIACGFHAGDPRIIDRTVAVAAERGVAIGAHVAYPDLRGFGRRHLDVSPEELAADVAYQIGALEGLARCHGATVSYVKAHGALYNDAAAGAELARAFAAAVARYRRDLPVVTLPGGALVGAAADVGLPVLCEAFADRSYEPDGSLTPRSLAGAVILDSAEVARRAVRLAIEHRVTARDGGVVEVDAATICLHGDTPGALAHARAVRSALRDAGVELAPAVTAARP